MTAAYGMDAGSPQVNVRRKTVEQKILITVLMSVYNTPSEYLCSAVDSILHQTYQNIEFIIIDDGSSGATKNTLRSFHDERIVSICNEHNLGLTKSLNIGLAAARGKYIARMDADDISLPERLEKQLSFMEDHPETAALGSYIESVKGKRIYHTHWTDDRDILRARMLFGNGGIPHPTAFFRAGFLKKHHILYDETLQKTQDYGMWVDILKQGGQLNLFPQILLQYRTSGEQISCKNRDEQLFFEGTVIERQLRDLPVNMSEEGQNAVKHFGRGNYEISPSKMNRYLDQIIAANRVSHMYDPMKLALEIDRIWVFGSVKRMKYLHHWDMLLSLRTLRILMPRAFMHFMHYIFLENYEAHYFKYKLFK